MSSHIPIDHYVLNTLMRDLVGHDRRPSAFLVYLALLDVPEPAWALSHAQMAERTGLSKRAVQDAIRHLAARQLVSIKRGGRSEPATVTPLSPWRNRA